MSFSRFRVLRIREPVAAHAARLCSPRVLLAAAATLVLGATSAAAQDAITSPSQLKRLSLEELANLQITSASRRPEALSDASSAIDVITADEIRRSGVTNIPDALRLATGLQVAQVDGHTWAISARGFNTTVSNKMQVVMDGRSLYTPLFSGVFWDVQHTFLPDLQQIEVIRGPGATLWGANAVNGVISISTKNARDTQGFLVYGGGGNEERGFGGVRYGGAIGKHTHYRAYITHLSRDSLKLEGNGSAGDDTRFTQGGFRIDSDVTADDTLTFQGDIYKGEFGQLNGTDVEVDGGNAIARWTRQLGADSSLMFQTYYDRTHRLIPNSFQEHRDTGDVEVQHRFRLADRHDVVYGANYRVSADEIGNLGPGLAFIPEEETLHLLSAYVQDQFQIVPRKFSVTAGSKFEYNSFSGFEIQPTGRFTWHPTDAQTVWGAVSRAVRTPTRIDQDLILPNPSTGAGPVLTSNRDFDSEILIAYELGYRVRPMTTVSVDLAVYRHEYSNLRSVEPPTAPGEPSTIRNMLEATTHGGAVNVKWRATSWWELEGSATLLHTDFGRERGSRDASGGSAEGNDPEAVLAARSAIDLPWNMAFDVSLRHVTALPDPATPAYTALDVRLGWSPVEKVELALVGRNLLDDAHPEFRGRTVSREVQRSVFGTFRWRF